MPIIYKAKIISIFWKFHGKIYHETSENTFKKRYGNHKKSFNHENRRADTEGRNTGDLKNSKHNLKNNFTFLKDADQQKEQVFVIYVWTKKFYHWTSKK